MAQVLAITKATTLKVDLSNSGVYDEHANILNPVATNKVSSGVEAIITNQKIGGTTNICRWHISNTLSYVQQSKILGLNYLIQNTTSGTPEQPIKASGYVQAEMLVKPQFIILESSRIKVQSQTLQIQPNWVY